MNEILRLQKFGQSERNFYLEGPKDDEVPVEIVWARPLPWYDGDIPGEAFRETEFKLMKVLRLKSYSQIEVSKKGARSGEDSGHWPYCCCCDCHSAAVSAADSQLSWLIRLARQCRCGCWCWKQQLLLLQSHSCCCWWLCPVERISERREEDFLYEYSTILLIRWNYTTLLDLAS